MSVARTGQILVFLVFGFVFLSSSLLAATETAPPARTLRFPEADSLGTLVMRDWDSTLPLVGSRCPARGEVRVPAGKDVCLMINMYRWTSPSLAALASLRPSDIQALDMVHAKLPGAEYAHLKGLTGLRAISLSNVQLHDPDLVHFGALNSLRLLRIANTAITGAGFVHLKGLPALRELELNSSTLTVEGASQIGTLTQLEKLDLRSLQLPDEGFAFLERLISLRDLNVTSSEITDGALGHLRGLNRLEKLTIWCRNVTDNGLAALGELDHLRDLTITYATINGEGLAHLARLPALRRLDLGNIKFSNAGVASLGKLVELETLSLSGCSLPHPGALQLGYLGKLKSLDLRAAKISDAGLAGFKYLVSLEELMLTKTDVGDAGLAHLAGSQRLRRLWLGQTRVTDAGLVHLAGLQALELLDLAGTRVGDAGLAHLARLHALRSLRLRSTEVSDAGLGHLSGLRSLERLDLGATRITGPGVAHLENLRELRWLSLDFTKITGAALTHLQELPALEHVDLRATEVGDAVQTLVGRRPSVRVLIDRRQVGGRESTEVRIDQEPPRGLVVTGAPGGLGTLAMRSSLTTLQPRPKPYVPPDMYVILRSLEGTLGDGWRGRVVKQGSVQPGQFAPGNGTHVVLAIAPDAAVPNRLGLRTIHLWFMEPSYRPLRTRPEYSLSARTTYLGRTDQHHIFYRVGDIEEKPGRRPLIAGSILENVLRLDSKKHVDLICQALASPDRELKHAAVIDLYLFAAHGDVSGNGRLFSDLRQWALPAFMAATKEGDEDMTRLVASLYDEHDALTVFGIGDDLQSVGRAMSGMTLLPALENRPDLSEAVYKRYLSFADHPPHFAVNPATLTCYLAPPSEETLRSVLLRGGIAFGPPLAGFQMAAIRHAIAAKYAGLAFEITPFACHRSRDTREVALEYFETVRDPSTAIGFFHALVKGWDRPADSPGTRWTDFMPPGRLLVPVPRGHFPADQSTTQLLASDWPWRGHLDLFCTMPFSDELRDTIRHCLKQINPTKPLDQGTTELVAAVVALNFLVRHSDPEMLPMLLPLLEMGPDPARAGTTGGGESESLYKQIVFNPRMVPCIFAAQCIIQLGPDASGAVLEYLEQQIARKGPAPPPVPRRPAGVTGNRWTEPFGRRPSEIELSLLILGFLADQKAYDEFKALGERLQGRYREVWGVADEWFKQGGRKLHLPPSERKRLPRGPLPRPSGTGQSLPRPVPPNPAR